MPTAYHLGVHQSTLRKCVFTALTMFLALASGGVGRADDGSPEQAPGSKSTAETGPPEVKLDKSQFNLFNPTPVDALRPFSTDRPGKTHSSLTVDAGHFQVEGDIWNYTWDHWTTDNTTQRAYTVVNPNLKIGITNWAEFDAFVPLYNTLAVKSRNGVASSVAMASGMSCWGAR